MKYLFFIKKWVLSNLRIIAIVLCLVAVIFMSSSIIIGFKYSLSPSYVGRQLIHQSILSTINLLTTIYDPVSIKSVSFGPNDRLQNINHDNFKRIEVFFEQTNYKKRIKIIDIQNEIIKTSQFQFRYQPFDEPDLLLLRRKFNLDDIIFTANNEFEKMILLRNWCRSQFRRFDYQPFMNNFNALKILSNKTINTNIEAWKPGQYRPCSLFPHLYAQVLLSMGYQARVVKIKHNQKRGVYDKGGHGMTEVWSNEFQKWVTMDADLNLYYEKDGIPLNMLEVHNERYEKSPSRIKIIRGIQTSGDLEHKKAIEPNEMIQYHSYIQVDSMRNDWMTNHYFRGHPAKISSLFWIDKNLPIVFNFKQKTDDVNDFYWTLNQTEILCKKEKLSHSILKLAFKTFTPNFKHYEIIIDDSKKITSKAAFYNWELHPGNNKFTIKSINKFGVSGIPSFVEIMFDSEA